MTSPPAGWPGRSREHPVAPGRSAPMGGRFARWNGQEQAPNREPSQGSTDEVRTSLSRVRKEGPSQLLEIGVLSPHHADRNITAWCPTILASLMFAGAVFHTNAKNRPQPPRLPASPLSQSTLISAMRKNSTSLSLRGLALLLLVVLQTEIIICFNDKGDQ